MSTSHNTRLTSGRILIPASNIFYSGGAFLADWSETHVLNPRWPPHAKFHNGQTMSVGALLAALSIYLTFRKTSSVAATRDSITLATIVGSFYCTAGLSAIFYPGTLWTDPEFGTGKPNFYIFSGQLVAIWLGYWLEIRRLGKVKAA